MKVVRYQKARREKTIHLNETQSYKDQDAKQLLQKFLSESMV